MKNKGYFKATDELITTNWKEIYIIFKDFRPTHIEFRFWEGNLWYLWGVSELFDEVKECEAIPQYDIIFTKDKNRLTYKFEKV